MKTKISFILILLIISVPSFAENSQIRIGLMSDLSGVHSSNGFECKRGYEIARKAHTENDRIGAYSLAFIYEDSQSSPRGGVNAFQKLTSVQNVDAVAFLSSRIAMAVNPISKRRKIPVVGLAANSQFTTGNMYAFGSWWDAAIEGQVLAKEMKKFKVNTTAVVTTEDDYTLSVKDNFAEIFNSDNRKILINETVAPEDFDFSGLVSKIKSKKPDAVLVNLVTGQTGNFIKELREQGYKGKLFGNFFVSKVDEIKAAGTAAIEGTLFVLPATNKRKFLELHDQLFPDKSISALTYACYAGLGLILQAIRDDLENFSSLYEAINNVTNIELLDETLAVKDRRIQYGQEVKVVSNGSILDFDRVG